MESVYKALIFIFLAVTLGVVIFGDKLRMGNETSKEDETISSAGLSAEFKQITILYKGDSITYGKKLSSNRTFAYIVNETLNNWAIGNQTSYRFKYVNTAVSGETSREALEEFFKEFDEVKPDIVFLMYGTNDVDFYNGDQRQSVYMNLDEMTSYALDNGAENVIIGLPPATESEKENEKILPLGLYLEEKFRDKEAVYIFNVYNSVDLDPSNDVQDGYSGIYYLDGVHLNEKGNEAVARELAPIIWNLTKSAPT